MKMIIQLAFIGALLFSCKKNSSNNTNNQNPSQQSPPPNNSFPTSFKPVTNGTNDFQVNGACWNHISWPGTWKSQTIYTQNNITWIDSLNYVVEEPLPITIVDASHISFNTYTLTQNPYIILSGTGTLINDTLATVISAKTMTINNANCSNQNFTFTGRYKKLP